MRVTNAHFKFPKLELCVFKLPVFSKHLSKIQKCSIFNDEATNTNEKIKWDIFHYFTYYVLIDKV